MREEDLLVEMLREEVLPVKDVKSMMEWEGDGRTSVSLTVPVIP